MTRPNASSPWVIWGGTLPSGSLKYLTFERYLTVLGKDAFARGLIEISEGCTALALDYLADRAQVPLVVLCSEVGAASLKARGFRATTQVPSSLAEALHICASKQQAGWHWPEQMSNQKLVAAVRAWAGDVVAALREQPQIDTVACGFGTGATVAGLESALAPLGYTVLGLQAPAGESVVGWRNYAEHNLGTKDLFHPHHQRLELQTARSHPTGVAKPLDVLLLHDWNVDPERLCVISHDGVPG